MNGVDGRFGRVGRALRRVLLAALCISVLPGCGPSTPEIESIRVQPKGHRWLRAKIPKDFIAYVGSKEGGSTFTHVFELMNHGPVAMRLSPQLEKSPDVLDAKLSKSILISGETCTLTVSIGAPLEHKQGVRAHVKVTVIEPANVIRGTFFVKYDSQLRWTVSPHQLSFQGYPAEPQEAEITVVGHADRELRITEVTSNLPGGVPQATDGAFKKGVAGKVTLRFHMPSQLGMAEHQVIIKTDDRLVPQVTIPVTCRTSSRFQVAPPQALVTLTSAEKVDREFAIRADSLFSLNATSTRSSSPGIRIASLETAKAAVEQRIRVAIEPALFNKGIHRCTLDVVVASSNGNEQIQIPIVVVK